MNNPPWALFITSKDVDADYINDLLTKAYEGNYQGGWYLWLATSNSSDAPQKTPDGHVPTATEPPISSIPTSWTNKKLADCVTFLQSLPPNTALHRNYFAVVNASMKEDDTVLLVRIVEPGEFDNGKAGTLQYFPVKREEVMMTLLTAAGIKFEEVLLNARRTAMKEGRKIKCGGGPFEDEYPDDWEPQE